MKTIDYLKARNKMTKGCTINHAKICNCALPAMTVNTECCKYCKNNMSTTSSDVILEGDT